MAQPCIDDAPLCQVFFGFEKGAYLLREIIHQTLQCWLQNNGGTSRQFDRLRRVRRVKIIHTDSIARHCTFFDSFYRQVPDSGVTPGALFAQNIEIEISVIDVCRKPDRVQRVGLTEGGGCAAA
jgi:hypothetical protein